MTSNKQTMNDPTQPTIRTLPRPSDINHNGHIFGDWLSVYTSVKRAGRTSVSVQIEVKVMRRDSHTEVTVTEGTFIYVRIDENGRPVPIDPE